MTGHSRRIAALALLASACSFFIAGPDKNAPPEVAPRCETSRRAPAADTVAFGVFGALSAVLIVGSKNVMCDANDPNCHGGPEELGVLAGVALLLPTAVYGVAAVVGYDKTTRCREAVDTHRHFRRQPADGEAPAPAPQW